MNHIRKRIGTRVEPGVTSDAATAVTRRGLLKTRLVLTTAFMLLPLSSGMAGEFGNFTAQQIWKTVPAASGEEAWHVCRRSFGRDVTRVRHGSPGSVDCYVPYHYLYAPRDRRQNFN